MKQKKVSLLTISCEVQITFIENGKKVKRWVLRPVNEIHGIKLIRCPYQHCAIRIHRKLKPNGPQDHFEHCSLKDSKDCPASSN